ncbi:phosphomannomutase [Cenarchaeum symbiosum A]|uniref:Phosphomannomutase n=1 Tax=Cenarchaeum symbiosum (strain A) TaxID=414004 RepID=A0RUB3_CENSY|nr:phosphomannomutase [Cenarchaeum symbiosum A]
MAMSISAHLGGGPVLVGHDGRHSGPAVAKAVCSALNYAGADCSLAGLVPTPCLEYSTRKLGYRGGIMVTASHNPPEYNGMKVVASDGVEIPREDEEKIEGIYRDKAFRPGEKYGVMRAEDGAIPAYLDGIKSQVDASAVRARGPSVVIDAGNGAQAVAAPQLCRDLGCTVEVINSGIDGDFPGRGPEPTPANLGGLSEAVLRTGADLGVAFDGDGDRSLFCDDKGEVLTGDRSALLLAGFVLGSSPGSAVVTCLNSGGAIEGVAAGHGSPVIRTKVGSVAVSRRMVSEDALVGFEENGGFMYGRHGQVRDGAMSLALMLGLVSSSDMPLSSMAAALPPSFTSKEKIPCSAADAERVLDVLRSEHPEADTTDGIRIAQGGSWTMVRPSGTEPLIRVYAESHSEAALSELLSGQVRRIREILDGG